MKANVPSTAFPARVRKRIDMPTLFLCFSALLFIAAGLYIGWFKPKRIKQFEAIVSLDTESSVTVWECIRRDLIPGVGFHNSGIGGKVWYEVTVSDNPQRGTNVVYTMDAMPIAIWTANGQTFIAGADAGTGRHVYRCIAGQLVRVLPRAAAGFPPRWNLIDDGEARRRYDEEVILHDNPLADSGLWR